MQINREMKVGVGFATGRKSFQKILRTYVYNWQESSLTDKQKIRLNLFVAYDLKYADTQIKDYINISEDVRDQIDQTYFIGTSAIQREIEHLAGEKVITEKEAQIVFGGGYAGKRNAVLYMALKSKMDCLLFLDDDEYPMAVTKNQSTALWGGQQVLSVHLEHIKHADITNGHHCGYISPIPHILFNETLTVSDFRLFIEAISNDIVSWDKIYALMQNGGVTYADTKILTTNQAEEVEEKNHSKFISGANLCINLAHPDRVSPFYNPPGARGEDTFLSTCLSERTVLRVPCYTFHDGFSTYNHLMDGVLPISLRQIRADNDANITRFYKACIGWIRYKPLLLYITDREHYDEKIQLMRENLEVTLPKICEYFGRPGFADIAKELEKYHGNVKKHYSHYLQSQVIWQKIIKFL